MSKLFKIAVAAQVVILGTTNSTSAQTKKQRKKPKVIQVTYAVEYPADPEDPIYKMTVGLPHVDKVELFYVTVRWKDQAPKTQPNTVEREESTLGEYEITAQNTLRGEAAKILPHSGGSSSAVQAQDASRRHMASGFGLKIRYCLKRMFVISAAI